MDLDKLDKGLNTLVGIMGRLRGPGGCPWDAKQTDASIRMYLLEEAYEVVQAVERGVAQEVCQELGDLLFQIIFLAQLASERNEFDLSQVMEGITAKMIRRHPHVFGEATVKGPEEVVQNWHRIKQDEKGSQQEPMSQLDSIPAGLPSLLRAHRLSERASKLGMGFDGTGWDKVKARVERLETALGRDDKGLISQEMGDLFFSLAHMARDLGYNGEDLLRWANQRFIDSFKTRTGTGQGETTVGLPKGEVQP